MADTLEERFKKAVWIIRNGEPIPTDNKTKLEFYSYFKQVSVNKRYGMPSASVKGWESSALSIVIQHPAVFWQW